MTVSPKYNRWFFDGRAPSTSHARLGATALDFKEACYDQRDAGPIP